jgi:transcriptional accessory protein Tex/SPT6
MANPFISARIPPELYKRVEDYVEETQESKTDLLTKALTTYLDSYTAQKQQEAGEINSIKTKISELERRLREVELFQKTHLLTTGQNINNLQIGARPDVVLGLSNVTNINHAIKNSDFKLDPLRHLGEASNSQDRTTWPTNRLPRRHSYHHAVPPEETERISD